MRGFSMSKLSLFFLMAGLLISVRGFSATDICSHKAVIKDGKSSNTLMQYVPSESETSVDSRTVISGIYKFVWNGKVLNIFRCSQQQAPPYLYDEKACEIKNSFKSGNAVLKNNIDPLITVSIDGNKLKIKPMLEKLTTYNVVFTESKTVINGQACSKYQKSSTVNDSSNSGQPASGRGK
jgi:hypothetical protein